VEVFSILDQLVNIGCFYLGFTGGEVFIRKDIFKILWYAKRKGFEIIIHTNGSLINERISEELSFLRPNKLDITIPAMTKKKFERITNVAGSHRKVFNAIDLLHKKGINLGFKSCLLKENEGEIGDIQRFARSLGVPHRLDDMLSPRLNGSKKPYQYRGGKKVGIDCKKSKNCNPEFLSPDYQAPVLFKCGAGLTQAAITPLGELKMCLMIDYPKYKILDTCLKECWQKLRKLTENIKPDENYKCNVCLLWAYCNWCPARGWLYNNSFSSCEPESRMKALAIKALTSYENKISTYA